MRSRVQDFLNNLADLFEAGDIPALACNYAEPLPIFAYGEFVVEASRGRVSELIFRMRGEALSRGVTQVQVNLLEIGPIGNRRSPVLVDWRFLDDQGQEVARSRVRYYCGEDSEGQIKVEMIEYLEIAFPTFLRGVAPHSMPN